MQHYRKALHAKIHRATVTHADVAYEGSITLPPQLMTAADLHEYEAVQVWDVSNGNRLETYVIRGREHSFDIAINGAAAHLIHPGDKVIIASFTLLPETALAGHRPRLVFVDERNQILDRHKEIAGPAQPLAA